MFNVIYVMSGRVETVYSIRTLNNGNIEFLIYETHSWKWVSSSNFRPAN